MKPKKKLSEKQVKRKMEQLEIQKKFENNKLAIEKARQKAGLEPLKYGKEPKKILSYKVNNPDKKKYDWSAITKRKKK